MVKRKVRIWRNFTARPVGSVGWLLPAGAILTFVASWAGVFPPKLVERWYARCIFPLLSALAEKVADLVPFAWLDVAIPLGIVCAVLLIPRRRWKLLANLIAALYLLFFWSWGLNYHRAPLASKLQFDSGRTQPGAIEQFAIQAATQINRLYQDRRNLPYDETRIRDEAVRRVEHVVQIIDGSDWQAAHRIKVSRLGDPWFNAAGIDGIFNPIAHEPIISNSVLNIERPFVIAHELAHVRGYPDEGDANVIAAFATLMSDDPTFQYSGWLSLWLYLRSPKIDDLLDPGPRADLERIFDRARRQQIGWINDLQRFVLDWFLKANNVQQGVRSYSRVVVLLAGTEPYWNRFR
jgi:hypothetical protein